MKCISSTSLSLLMSFLLVGCSSGIYPVEGIVTWNGEVVEGATVTLIPEGEDGSSDSACGFTDTRGHFTLWCLNREGVASGKYKILVFKKENIAEKISDETKDDPTKAMQQFSKIAKAETPKMPGIGSGKGMMPSAAMKMMPGKNRIGALNQKHLLPEKYARVETTPFRLEVPANEPLKLELVGEGPKK